MATIQDALLKCAPYARTIQSGAECAVPYLHIAFQKYQSLALLLTPYRVDLLFPAFLGLILCFFGGSYVCLIAAVEAYRMCGYEQSLKCLKELQEDYKIFLDANAKDNLKDADGDGVADVTTIDPQQLATRKTLLFLKTVDPLRLTTAISGLNAGFLAVVGCLKLQFAKAITLGNALGDIAKKPASTYLVPALEAIMPPEYKKWAEPLIMYTLKTACISLAWFLQRILSAIHSAIRGGTMVSRNLLEYSSKMGYFHINHEDTILDEVVGAALATIGLWFQLSTGFGLPFPLNILLFPFTMIEYFIMWTIAK